MRNAAVLLVALAVAPAALAQSQPQAPTPIPQSVVVPSLPDQKNKEGVVRPGATQQTDAGGWVQTNMDPNAVKPASSTSTSTSEAPAATARPEPGPGIGVAPAPPSQPAPSPTGPAVVNAASLSVRGVVKAYEKGVSITITEANGKDRIVPLTAKTSAYEGLAAGDKVIAHVPLKKPADGKTADRVEKQKPPKAQPKSKFAAAQSPAS